VTTYQRPAYLFKCLRALKPLGYPVWVHNDGSSEKFRGEYKRAYARLDCTVQDSPVNEGVAKSKNHLLRAMLDAGADWLFLCEDDILVQDSRAITGYVAACEETGMHHLSFHAHGPANAGIAGDPAGPVTYWPHSIGAWTIFSRECLEGAGLFDESMLNAFEHVEHEMRLIHAGYMPGAGAFYFPDATGSEAWISEIPGSIEHSAIRPRSDWSRNIHDSLAYWRDNKPETYAELFGEGTRLHDYANRILGL
jgi:GT2 family glycosyltransferase